MPHPLISISSRYVAALTRQVQLVGIDLPLKALVYEDAAGKAWLAYNDPRWLARRHGLGSGQDAAVNAMLAALDASAMKGAK